MKPCRKRRSHRALAAPAPAALASTVIGQEVSGALLHQDCGNVQGANAIAQTVASLVEAAVMRSLRLAYNSRRSAARAGRARESKRSKQKQTLLLFHVKRKQGLSPAFRPELRRGSLLGQALPPVVLEPSFLVLISGRES